VENRGRKGNYKERKKREKDHRNNQAQHRRGKDPELVCSTINSIKIGIWNTKNKWGGGTVHSAKEQRDWVEEKQGGVEEVMWLYTGYVGGEGAEKVAKGGATPETMGTNEKTSGQKGELAWGGKGEREKGSESKHGSGKGDANKQMEKPIRKPGEQEIGNPSACQKQRKKQKKKGLFYIEGTLNRSVLG